MEPRHYTRRILEELAPHYCRGKLLDIGAGKAKYQRIFQPFITEYVGVDDMSSSVQFPTGARAGIVRGDALSLPFGNESFDTVCSIKLLEHVKNPFVAFSEMARVLKPAGYCIVSSDWMTPYHEEPLHYWHFSEDAYRTLGESSGLIPRIVIQQGGVVSSLFYICVRTVQLHGGVWGRRIIARANPLIVILEKLCERLDRFVPSKDGTGHVVVFQKS